MSQLASQMFLLIMFVSRKQLTKTNLCMVKQIESLGERSNLAQEPQLYEPSQGRGRTPSPGLSFSNLLSKKQVFAT